MTTYRVRSLATGSSVLVVTPRAWDAHRAAGLVSRGGHRLAFGECRCEVVESPGRSRRPAVKASESAAAAKPDQHLLPTRRNGHKHPQEQP